MVSPIGTSNAGESEVNEVQGITAAEEFREATERVISELLNCLPQARSGTIELAVSEQVVHAVYDSVAFNRHEDLSLELTNAIQAEISKPEYSATDRLVLFSLATFLFRSKQAAARQLAGQAKELMLQLDPDEIDLSQLQVRLRMVLVDAAVSNTQPIDHRLLAQILDPETAQQQGMTLETYLRVQALEYRQSIWNGLSPAAIFQLCCRREQFFDDLDEMQRLSLLTFASGDYAVAQCPRDLLTRFIDYGSFGADMVLEVMPLLSDHYRWNTISRAFAAASNLGRQAALKHIQENHWYNSLPGDLLGVLATRHEGGLAYFLDHYQAFSSHARASALETMAAQEDEEADFQLATWILAHEEELDGELLAELFKNHSGLDFNAYCDRSTGSRLLQICFAKSELYARIPEDKRKALVEALVDEEKFSYISSEFLKALMSSGEEAFSAVLAHFGQISVEARRLYIQGLVRDLWNPLSGLGEERVARLLFVLAEGEAELFDLIWSKIVDTDHEAEVREHFPQHEAIQALMKQYQHRLMEIAKRILDLKRVVLFEIDLEAGNAEESLNKAKRLTADLSLELIRLARERRGVGNRLMIGCRVAEEGSPYLELRETWKTWKLQVKGELREQFDSVYKELRKSKHGFNPSEQLGLLLEHFSGDRERVSGILQRLSDRNTLAEARESYVNELELGGQLRESLKDIQPFAAGLLREELSRADSAENCNELSMLFKELSTHDAHGIIEKREESLMGISQLIQVKLEQIPRTEDPIYRMDMVQFLGESGAGGLCNIRLYGREDTPQFLGCTYQEMTTRGFGFDAKVCSLKHLRIDPHRFIQLQRAKRELKAWNRNVSTESLTRQLSALAPECSAAAQGAITRLLASEEWTKDLVAPVFLELTAEDPLKQYLVQPGITEFWAGLAEKDIDDLDLLAEAAAKLEPPVELSPELLLDLNGELMQSLRQRLME